MIFCSQESVIFENRICSSLIWSWSFKFTSNNQSKNIAMTMSATEKEWNRNELDFSFDFFEILIVLAIVIFDKSSTSGSLLLFLEELLDGTSHWSYNEDNLYWLTDCFGARPISHEIVTKFVMLKMLKALIKVWPEYDGTSTSVHGLLRCHHILVRLYCLQNCIRNLKLTLVRIWKLKNSHFGNLKIEFWIDRIYVIVGCCRRWKWHRH